MRGQIISRAKSLGITQVGFCKHLCKTAVCCLFPYFEKFDPDANLSAYTYSRDYHMLAREKLTLLMSPFDENAEIIVDIGGNDDRDIAYRAGLGFYGKHNLLINPDFGTYFFIGYALTDLQLPLDTPLTGECTGCGACARACPGRVLGEHPADYSRCASAISQKKGKLSRDETEILKKSGLIFGCDTCQKVCPHNAHTKAPMEEFTKDLITRLELSDLSDLSNKEFLKKYGDRAFSWRGKGVLLRNLKILSGIK